MSGNGKKTGNDFISGFRFGFNVGKKVVVGSAKLVKFSVDQIGEIIKAGQYREAINEAKKLAEPGKTTVMTNIIRNWYDAGGDERFKHDIFSAITSLHSPVHRRDELVKFHAFCDKRRWYELSRNVALML